ncbi:MAG: hypothetical protein ABEJ57_01090 [Halobacteriaceae archaeon]
MASEATGAEDATALARELEAAAADLEAAEAAVEEIGEDRLDALEAATNQLARILDQYEDSATGSGDFEAYMECRMAVQDLEEGLGDALPNRERFEAVAERFDSRRLSDRDFQWANEELAAAREPLSRLRDREAAREDLATARRAVLDRLEVVEDRIDRLETVAALGRADLDAPVEAIEEPIREYNDAVEAAFESFLSETGARTVFSFLSTTTAYPLVDVTQPPRDLAEYVDRYAAGTEPIPTLLEYAEYSRSKLDHYVEEPMELKRHVATHRTYLTRLDATPYTIEWPPPPAARLRYRTEELVSVVDRFADPETVATLHAVRAAVRREDFDSLRASARAAVELDEEEREQVRSGAVEAELESLRDQRETLESALSTVD